METLGSKLNWETCWWRWSVTGLHGGEINLPTITFALHCFAVCWLLHVCLAAAHFKIPNKLTIDERNYCRWCFNTGAERMRSRSIHCHVSHWDFGSAASWLCNLPILARQRPLRKEKEIRWVRLIGGKKAENKSWAIRHSENWTWPTQLLLSWFFCVRNVLGLIPDCFNFFLSTPLHRVASLVKKLLPRAISNLDELVLWSCCDLSIFIDQFSMHINPAREIYSTSGPWRFSLCNRIRAPKTFELIIFYGECTEANRT